jgi:outer membrane protein
MAVMMRRKLAQILCACSALFLSVVGNAAAACSEICVVDMQRLVSSSILGKAARSDMENEAKKRESALAARKIELDKLREEISKQAAVLSQGALEEKKTALEKRARDFEADVRAQRDELGRRNTAAVKKIVGQIDSVVKDLAAERHYKFILEKDERLVIYSGSELDITDEVLKVLDKKKIGM